MIRKFLSNQGFTTVQALMFAGVMAAGALVMTRTITDLKLTQKGAEVRDDLETFHASIVSALQDSKHCTATHLYNMANPGAYLIMLQGGDQILAKETETYMNNAIRVTDIEFNAAASPMGNYTITYSKLKSSERLKQGFGGKDVRKVIPVNFVFNGSTFNRCYLDENVYNSQTAQEFCTSLGNFMVWDPLAKKCSLRSHNCSTQPGTVFAGIDSNGKEICQKITDAIVTKDLFGVGTVNCPNRSNLGLTVMGGQIVITCNPGGCIPTTACSSLRPTDCPALPNLFDSCGLDCGAGTKASGCITCTPSCPAANTICSGSTFTGSDGCGGSCNVAGTKTDGICASCTPSCPNPALVCAGDTSCGGNSDGCGGICPMITGTSTTPVPGCLVCESSCTPTCPAANTICQGTTDSRPNGCGTNCNVVGTKTDGVCAPACQPNGTQCSDGATGYQSCSTCCTPPAVSNGCCCSSGYAHVYTCGSTDATGCGSMSGGPGQFCALPPQSTMDCDAGSGGGSMSFCCNGARSLDCTGCTNSMGPGSCGGPPYDYIDCFL